MSGQKSKTGVYVYDNFRDNLIIDRYNPIYHNMRKQKVEHFKSENSEDAITWNVFRTLLQINPKIWLPRIYQLAFKKQLQLSNDNVNIKLWQMIKPPPLLESKEGPSEIDILIETGDFVWAIEAKYKSDVSKETTHGRTRNQIIRNIDVGSFYAQKKDFYFSILVLDESHSPIGWSLVEKYGKSKDMILADLPHRKNTDQLDNMKGIGCLTWENIRGIFEECEKATSRENERYLANQVIEWLNEKVRHSIN